MSGYGIAGADASMAAALVSVGWQEQAPGFYRLESGSLGDVVATIHALNGCVIPRGCCLFAMGDSVDLSTAMGGSSSPESAVAPSFTAGGARVAERNAAPVPAASAVSGVPAFPDLLSAEHEEGSERTDAAADDDDDYSLEMLRLFGLRQ